MVTTDVAAFLDAYEPLSGYGCATAEGRLIEALINRNLDSTGGYPGEVDDVRIPEWIVAADRDDGKSGGKPVVRVWRRDTVAACLLHGLAQAREAGLTDPDDVWDAVTDRLYDGEVPWP